MSLSNITTRLRERFQTPDRAPPPERLGDRRVARLGYAIIIGTFGVLGVWAAFAPLDSAVIAPGVVSVESSRKTLQHLEGGIIRSIHVREGEHVEPGQLLFELDSTQARASFDIARTQLIRLRAQEARLAAERDNRAALTFPPDLASQTAPEVTSVLADERRIFEERSASIRGQVDILTARLEQFRSEIEGINREIESLRRQGEFLDDEISGLRELFEKNLVPKPRLLALERERAAVDGRIGRLIADRAKAQEGISEANLQIRQLRRQFFEEASKELADVRTKLGEIQERYAVAADAVRRIQIRAPVSGTAQSLRVSTIGAVVRPGEPLVDVVPDKEELVVHAHFAPVDADNVAAGMTTEVQFPAFHAQRLPVINGVIESVSGDRLIDDATNQPYFLGIIRVSPEELPPQLRGKLQPGLPAQVVVPTGERTVLQYMFEPLTRALRVSGREE